MIRVNSTLARFGMSALLATGLVAASATAALAKERTPFNGWFNETFVIVSPPPILVADASGSGHASHIGQATENFVGTVNFTNIDPVTGCAIDSAVGTIVGANTDTISITAAGEYCAASGIDSGTFTITGGTGHFVGVTGGGTYTSVANLTAGTSQEIYDGTIQQ